MVGVADVDRAAIDAANAVDPMITVATVPRWQRMAPGGMVATVKIIAYGVAGEALERAAEAGLVHSVSNSRLGSPHPVLGGEDQLWYICNCCTCCCIGIQAVNKHKIPMAASSGLPLS